MKDKNSWIHDVKVGDNLYTHYNNGKKEYDSLVDNKVLVLDIKKAAKCESGVLFLIMNISNEILWLDSGWFYKE